MNRYTHLIYGSSDSYDLKCRDVCDLDTDMECIDCPVFEMAVQQLGEYEATGLSPKEASDMQTDWVVLKRLANERKWISVNDRLPKENGKYLCVKTLLGSRSSTITTLRFATDLHKLGYADFHEFKYKGMSGFYDYDGEIGYYDVDGVTHWQPLPPPPEEE